LYVPIKERCNIIEKYDDNDVENYDYDIDNINDLRLNKKSYEYYHDLGLNRKHMMTPGFFIHK
jgi:hypothetical protein